MNEQQFFDLKQKFLRDIPHPRLIQKAIEQLAPKEAVAIETASQLVDHADSLTLFLDGYMQELMPLKLTISSSKDAAELASQLQYLLKLQKMLIQKLHSYFPGEKPVADIKDIKQSQPFDVYAYQKELKQSELEENQIKAYLCRQFKLKDVQEMSELTKGVIRSNKIVEHGRKV